MQKMILRRLACVFPIASLMALGAVSAHAQAFTAGDLVVYRVGTGSAALTSASTAVFLDEYSTTGTLVESIAMPTSVSGANQMLTASGTATSEGELNLSANGQHLAFTGYDSGTGVSGIATSVGVNRVVGLIGANGIADTTTQVDGAATTGGIGGSNIRAAYTADGTNIYIATANEGIDYTTYGSAGTTAPTFLDTTSLNARDVEVVNGQLYESTDSGSFRIVTVGTGTPTTNGQTVAELTGVPTSIAPYAFSFTSLGGGGTPDTLYVADTASIDKFSLIAGSWTETGTITGVTGIEGLTETTVGGIATLYATDPTGIYSFIDTTGFDGTVSGTAGLIASAGTNEAFRGIAFAPSAGGAAAAPEPGSLFLGALGLLPIAGAAIRRRVTSRG